LNFDLIVFGTDVKPYILQISKSGESTKLPVPWSLELGSYQAGCRMSDGSFFICGGWKSTNR